jgi:hypothetical protein
MDENDDCAVYVPVSGAHVSLPSTNGVPAVSGTGAVSKVTSGNIPSLMTSIENE